MNKQMLPLLALVAALSGCGDKTEKATAQGPQLAGAPRAASALPKVTDNPASCASPPSRAMPKFMSTASVRATVPPNRDRASPSSWAKARTPSMRRRPTGPNMNTLVGVPTCLWPTPLCRASPSYWTAT